MVITQMGNSALFLKEWLDAPQEPKKEYLIKFDVSGFILLSET